MTESAPKLLLEGRYARVLLNRPAFKNRLQPEDVAALHEIFVRLAGEAELRVVVITGAGDSFSAGFDLNALAAGEVGDAASGPGGFGAMVDALERLPQPTIARLNGGVYGGATDLALACDFRVGVTSMQAAMPAARIGLHYYRSGILRYASRLGHDNAKRMFLTAERLDAVELYRIGFLTRLVDPAGLDSAVDELAQTLAANAPLAMQGVKLALNELARGEWDETVFAARATAALKSEDLKEGVAAVIAKRAARFLGR
jgi:enoyl-CoA hydratase/carnithine racemase